MRHPDGMAAERNSGCETPGGMAAERNFGYETPGWNGGGEEFRE